MAKTALPQVENDAELRETLMRTEDLWRYFCDRMRGAVMAQTERANGAPNVAAIVASGAFALFFFVIAQPTIAVLLLSITAAQIFWFFFYRAGNIENGRQRIIADLDDGKIAPSLYEHALKLLRWWDCLLIPSEWTANSRVFGIRPDIAERVKEIDDELVYWRSDAGKAKLAEQARLVREAALRHAEQQKKLRMLQSRGAQISEDEKNEALAGEAKVYNSPQELTVQITTPENRRDHMTRILGIVDRQVRAQQEKMFHESMLIKIDKLAELLAQADALRPTFTDLNAVNLSARAKEIVTILQRRRNVVRDLNRIRFENTTQLLKYHINFVKSADADAALKAAKEDNL